MKTALIGVVALAVVFAVTGVVFIYLGSSGNTTLSFFGANVATTNVGVAALVLAAAMVVLTIRKVFSYMHGVVHGESKPVGSPDKRRRRNASA